MRELDLDSGGQVGFFWPISDTAPSFDTDDSLRGWVRREGDETLVDLLDEQDPFRRGAAGMPEFGALAGVVQKRAMLMLELRTATGSIAFGARASWVRCSARTVLENVDVLRLRSSRLMSLRADFLGVGRWAGMQVIKETFDYDDDGLTQGFSLGLSAHEDEVAKLSNGRNLRLSSEWHVGGTEDRRVIDAPVSLTCSAVKPLEVWHLLQPLLQFQDLLSLSHEGAVLADSGAGVADLGPDVERGTERSPLWCGALMTRSSNVRRAKLNDLPLFTLESIGGVAGVRRWISLATAHPRATAPLTGSFRRGFSTPDITVRDVATAMEYWVRSCRPAKWAEGKKFAEKLARRLGPAFEAWAGDVEKWGYEFWSANNHLKHDPGYASDNQYLADLAVSGRYVLLASLLNRVAGSREPGRQILGSYRVRSVGQRLQEPRP